MDFRDIKQISIILGGIGNTTIDKMPDDIISLIAFYSLSNNININELKNRTNLNKCKYFIKNLLYQWRRSTTRNWEEFIDVYTAEEELIVSYNTLGECKCCKRHQDYTGINSVLYLAKDRRCKCSCRHDKRHIERVLTVQGFENIPHAISTNYDWDNLNHDITKEYGVFIVQNED
jgi:hypothetical protein